VIVGAYGGDLDADTTIEAESPSGLICNALTAVIPSGTTFGDLNASTTVSAPSASCFTNALTTVVVVVWAFLGNEDAVVQSWAEGVSWEVGQALSAIVMSGTTDGDLNAFIGGRAKAKTGLTVLVAFSLISR
jgi:hypothetical protein